MEKNKIAIIIPCYNESKTINSVCNKAKKFGKILIINDNSKDSTEKILKKKNFFYLNNKQNIGYEKSLLKGFNYVLKKWKKIKFIITIDADNELPPNAIPLLLKKKKIGNADIIIGNRNKLNRLTEKILSLLFHYFYKFRDPISGLKLYNIKIIKKNIQKVSRNLFLVDILLISIHKGYKIACAEIKVNKRKGKSRVGSILAVNLKIIKIIFFSLFYNFTFRL